MTMKDYDSDMTLTREQYHRARDAEQHAPRADHHPVSAMKTQGKDGGVKENS